MYLRLFHIFLLNVHEDSFGISNLNYPSIMEPKPPKMWNAYYYVHVRVYLCILCVL